jgi:hypothetical protein
MIFASFYIFACRGSAGRAHTSGSATLSVGGTLLVDGILNLARSSLVSEK